MKYIVLVPDGVSDEPCEALGGKTPLESSHMPNLTWFCENGRMGRADTIPAGLSPGSDVGHLSILGYNPKECYTGRAPLEAANMGIKLNEGEVAFRMNLVTDADGKMADYSAGHISTTEAHTLVDFLKGKIDSEKITLYPGIQYRHIAVIKDSAGIKGLSAECVPPHDIQDQSIEDHWPTGNGSDILKDIMEKAKIHLKDHEINQVRVDLNENPANMIWLWGQGVMPKIETFESRFGIKGSIVSAVDLVCGIGRLAELEILPVPDITGYVDTNYEGKVEFGLNSLKEKDFIYIHVEATDETAHQGNPKLKVEAIEDFDSKIVGPVRRYLEENPDTRVLIMPDHSTSCNTRTHFRSSVPFVVAGKGIESAGGNIFTEAEAAESEVVVNDAYKILPTLLKK